MMAGSRVAWLVLVLAAMSACRQPEDPARTAIRARLKQGATLSQAELGRVLDEVGRSIAGRTIQMDVNGATQALEGPRRDIVLGTLTDRAGMFDEGLRTEGGLTVRVINEPAAGNSEIEATRRLWIDVETLLPRRFEFSSAFPSPDDYSFDLVVGR